MPGVREPAGEEAAAHPVDELLADDHRAERHIPGVDALRDRDDVRDDVPVLAGEPRARAPEAGHDLVEDQQDPVPVADLAHGLQVAGRAEG